jgi:hypothetical protein
MQNRMPQMLAATLVRMDPAMQEAVTKRLGVIMESLPAGGGREAISLEQEELYRSAAIRGNHVCTDICFGEMPNPAEVVNLKWNQTDPCRAVEKSSTNPGGSSGRTNPES